jgi:peptide-methionine (S)-S-oxide reductase
MVVPERVAFGGGCHWCTEAVFASLRGVVLVEQGWVSSEGMDFSEAVVVHFDPAQMPLRDLVDVHLHTHSASSAHGMRNKYRSAVYCFSESQLLEVALLLCQAQGQFDKPLVTRALPFEAFKPSPEQYRQYYFKNPQKPFCERWIGPKLRVLQERYAMHVKTA